MTKKTLFFSIVIILIAFAIRIYNVQNIPSGFYSDEALFGYEAYSISKTAKDQFGTFLPVSFQGFGDFRPGLFIYATVPFIRTFGLTEFATRLPSVVFSTLTAAVIIALSFELFKKRKQALVAGWFFAISPWSIQFARMSHETNLATFLALLAILLLIKSIKNIRFLPFSLGIFTLAMYAYYTTRLFIPLFLIAAFILFRKHILLNIKMTLIGILFAVLLSIPLLLTLLNKDTGWSRVEGVSLWGDKGIKADTIQYRQEDILTSSPVSRVFHNKLIDGGQRFVESLLIHLEPNFLLITGDPNKLYNTPGNGILMYIEPLLIGIAVVLLITTKNPYGKLLSVWFIFGLLPDALTRFAPASARIHLILPLLSILSGIGFIYLFDRTKKTQILGAFVIIFTGLNSMYFLHNNFFHVPIRYAKEWQYDMKKVVKKTDEYSKSVDQIWISPRVGSWIHYIFYLQYPPEKLQREISLTQKDEYGFGRVKYLNKYYFEQIPGIFDLTRNILYVGEPEEFDSKLSTKEIIYYPNNMPAYYFVTTDTIKKDIELGVYSPPIKEIIKQ